MKFFEHSERSIVKTITYRILIVISTFIITFYLTGELKFSLELTAVANIVNTVLYYLHERVWNKVRWGKTKG